jgi:lipoprotein-anchoring transpeptidase ErfK/SrfK
MNALKDMRVRSVIGRTLGVAAAAVVLAPVATGSAASSRPDRELSNETTFTTFTTAVDNGPIRAQPAAGAKVLRKLASTTPDGFQQTYILLREHWTGKTPWVKVRIPMRPNGRVGWVLRSDLDVFRTTHMELVVNRAARSLTLYSNGHAIFHAPVGVGKPSTPTPAGHFWLTESFRVSTQPAYGPWAFGTSDYSVLSDWPGGGIVGVHGTNEPSLVPGDPSHGCIRMHNADVLRLKALFGSRLEFGIGTPLLVK